MKYWLATCPSCGLVRIKQARIPKTCKEEVQVTVRTTRPCARALSGVRDISPQVEAARASRELVVS